MPEKKFPRTLYKSGGPKKWGRDKQYSDVLVEDEAELKAAVKAGYVDSFQDALFEEKKEEPVKDEDMEFDIRYLDEYTKPQIIVFLKRTEIEFNPRDKVGVLKNQLRDLKEEE